MRPKAITISIVALLLIGASSHLMALRVSAQVTAPVIIEGDFWEYKMSYSYEGLEMEGTKKYTITGYKEITIGDSEHSVFIMDLDGGGSHEGTSEGIYMKGDWSINGKAYHDKNSFHLVKTVSDLEMTGTWVYGATGSLIQTTSNTTNYEIIDEDWEYPIEVGSYGEVNKKASSYVVMHTDWGTGYPESDFSETYHYYENVTYSCIMTEAISVPAGTFKTYKIKMEFEDGMYYLMWESIEVGNFVQAILYDENGSTIKADELTAYSYKSSIGDILLENLLYIILVIGVGLVAVAIGLMILNRRKRRAVKVLMKKPTEPPSIDVLETQNQKPPSTEVT